MKVIINQKPTKAALSELKQGDMFHYDDEYYMKTDEDKTVRLRNGFICYFGEDEETMVTPYELAEIKLETLAVV